MDQPEAQCPLGVVSHVHILVKKAYGVVLLLERVFYFKLPAIATVYYVDPFALEDG